MKWCAAVVLVALLGTCSAYAAAENQVISAKANEPQKAASKPTPTMHAGQAIYVDNCSACHAETGAGLAGLFPALKSNPAVKARDPSFIIRLVLEGGKDAATDHLPTGTAMPSFGWKLSDKQVAAVISYIRNSWGNAAQAVSASKVGSIREKDCKSAEARLHLHPNFEYFCKK